MVEVVGSGGPVPLCLSLRRMPRGSIRRDTHARVAARTCFALITPTKRSRVLFALYHRPIPRRFEYKIVRKSSWRMLQRQSGFTGVGKSTRVRLTIAGHDFVNST